MLCIQCLTLSFRIQERSKPPSDSFIATHHPSLPSLQASASLGCHFCTVLSHQLNQPPPPRSTLGRAKPKPWKLDPELEGGGVILYCEGFEKGGRPGVIFAFAGEERSVGFEVLELEGGCILIG